MRLDLLIPNAKPFMVLASNLSDWSALNPTLHGGAASLGGTLCWPPRIDSPTPRPHLGLTLFVKGAQFAHRVDDLPFRGRSNLLCGLLVGHQVGKRVDGKRGKDRV
jgi:hypothetical protein